MKKGLFGIIILALLVGTYFRHSATSARSEEASSQKSSQQAPPANASPRRTSNKTILALTAGHLTHENLTESFLNDLRARIQPSDLLVLSQTAIHLEASPETRHEALYVLTQMGAAALPALTEVATSPLPEAAAQDPHSLDQRRLTFESGLRINAMEALDQLGLDANLSGAVKDSMLNVLKVQKHRSLIMIAQISLAGIESGRPGKVKRAVDALLEKD